MVMIFVFLDSGLCQAFPSLLCGKGRESEFGQEQKLMRIP